MLAAFIGTDLLWRNALIALPIAALVALLCRCMPSRPATRHLLWFVVLIVLFAPPAMPAIKWPRLWRADAAVARPTAPPRIATPISSPRVEVAAPQSVARGFPHSAAPFVSAPPRIASSTPRLAPAPLAATPSPIRQPTVQGLPVTVASDRPKYRAIPRPWAFGTAGRLAPKPETNRGPSLAASSSYNAHKPPQAEVAVKPTPDAQPAAANPPPSSVPSVAATKSALTVALNLWIDRLSAVLTAIRALPPFPPLLWLVGSLTLGLVAAIRLIQHRRLFKGSVPAPRSVADEVEEASKVIGLPRAPHTLMVRGRVSPMIWCGRRPVLVLPTELWADLDEVGRRAVIHHELAHLKRRDHWICWAELIAVAIYWWNPLVWWVRRRLREEADLCCDAWVTALFPQGRRAYAQALLNTRRFISESPTARPDVGLGAISSGARHFARRLTMVMTQRTTPRRSLPGVLLAATVAAAGFLAAPLLACPPEDEKQQAQKELEKAKVAKERVAKEKARRDRGADEPAVVTTPATPRTPRAALAPTAPQPPRASQAPRAPRAPRTATPPEAVTVPLTPAPPAEGSWSTAPRSAPDMYARRPGAAAQPSPQARPGAVSQPRPAQVGQPTSPEGMRQMERRIDQLDRKLDEMNHRLDQMLRRLERQGSAIEAIPESQALLARGLTNQVVATVAGVNEGDGRGAIIILMGPDGKVEAFKLGENEMGALTGLLAGSGSRLPVRLHSDQHAAAALAERALVDEARLNASRVDAESRAAALAAEYAVLADQAAAAASEKAHAEYGKVAEHLASMLDAERPSALESTRVDAESRAAAIAAELAARADHLAAIGNHRAHAGAHRQAAERLRERAEQLTERAESMQERIEQLLEQAESLKGAEKADRLKQVETIRKQIEELQSAAEQLQDQAESLADHAGNLSDEAEEFMEESADEPSEGSDDESDDETAAVIIETTPEPSCCTSPAPAVSPAPR